MEFNDTLNINVDCSIMIVRNKSTKVSSSFISYSVYIHGVMRSIQFNGFWIYFPWANNLVSGNVAS